MSKTKSSKSIRRMSLEPNGDVYIKEEKSSKARQLVEEGQKRLKKTDKHAEYQKAKPEEETKKTKEASKKEKEKALKLNGLTRMKDATLGACHEEMRKWTRVSMAVDSGACDSVADPAQFPCNVLETAASRSEANFASATGEPIPNLGEMRVPLMTREGTRRSMKVTAAPVTKPLASVKKICQAGHRVIFDEEGSFIVNKRTEEVNALREEDGNHMLDMWVMPNDDEGSTFQGPS